MSITDYLMAAPWWHWIFFVILGTIALAVISQVVKKLTIFKIDKRTESHTHTHTHQHIHNPEK